MAGMSLKSSVAVAHCLPRLQTPGLQLAVGVGRLMLGCRLLGPWSATWRCGIVKKWLFCLLPADRAKFQQVIARVVPVFLTFFEFWQNDRIRFYDLDDELFVRLGILAMFPPVKVERVRDLVKNQLDNLSMKQG